MNSIIRKLKFVKQRIRLVLKWPYFKLFSGKVECNICGWCDKYFDSDSWHPNTICPKCYSQVRQRLFWGSLHFLTEVDINKILLNKKVLHFAPDKCLTKKIVEKAAMYKTADILAKGYNYESVDLNIDISNMTQIKNQEFDCVIACDVLEHVPDHLKAIEETNRILIIGGYCVFTIPQKDNLEKTYEDLSITDPKEREEKFGQWDHLRIYGSDFKNMLENRGFEVTVVKAQDIEKNLVEKHVLFPPILSKHPLATNYRKFYFGKKVRECIFAGKNS